MTTAAMPLRVLHRRLAAGMGIAALTAFISGAGFEAPAPLFAVMALVLSLFWAPDPKLQRFLDPAWRLLAIVLTARAFYRVFTSPEDVVLPMVDLLLVLLVSENLRETGTPGDTRVYSLSFALLVASCAYRPGVVFAASFVTYMALAVVALMVGHLIRKLKENNARDVRLDRAYLLRIASLSGIMLTLSALVFVAFPRVSRGWVTRGMRSATSVIGFSDRVSLAEHGGRLYPNPEVVLRVEFPNGLPVNTRALYWRGRTYDMFDGIAWDRSPRLPRSGASPMFYARTWAGRRLLERVYAVPLDIPVLFGVHPVLTLQPHSPMRAMWDNYGDLWYFGAGAALTYDILSVIDLPSREALRSAVGPSVPGEHFYLQIPPLSRRVHALADSITRNATTRYDTVMAVQNYLHSNFRYTLELPNSAREATLEYFLFRRRAGHCEYFSTAMAVLLREVGVPTRNVNGFLGGTWNDFGKFLTITQNEAHSWIEVYFPGYGWVPFDGTPAASTDVAAQQRNWLGPFRAVVDGLEHRWNKWILEYNLESQVNIFRRVSQSFVRVGPQGKVRWNPTLTRGIKLIVMVAGLLFVVSVLFRRVRFDDLSSESRLYLKLRRRYQKAGYVFPDHTTPMLFVEQLEQKQAPGNEHVRKAVELYLRSRFGGEDIGEAGKRELREAADAAQRALRAA